MPRWLDPVARCCRLHRTALGLAVGTVALLLLLGAFFLSLRGALEATGAQARALAVGVAAPLSRGDRKAAAEFLRVALQGSHVAHAAVYTPKGEVFVEHARTDAAPARPTAVPPGDALWRWRSAIVSASVTSLPGSQAQLVLTVGTAPLYRHSALPLGMAFGAGLLAASLAWALRRAGRIWGWPSAGPDRSGHAIVSQQEQSALERAVEHLQQRPVVTATQPTAVAIVDAQAASPDHGITGQDDVAEGLLVTVGTVLRAPLQGLLKLNESLLASELAPDQRIWADGVHSSGHHVLEVMNNALDLALIAAGRLPLQDHEFSLVDLVHDAMAPHVHAAHAKGLELAAEFRPVNRALRVQADAYRLRQALSKLVGSAVKFTDDGAVMVHVEQQEAGPQRCRITIRVEDTARGPRADLRRRMFVGSKPAWAMSEPGFETAALELALCQALLALMHGSIRMESADGTGNACIVDLVVPAGAQLHEPARAALGGRRVLAVDDHAGHRAILQRQLEAWGVQVDVAGSGPEALDRWMQSAQTAQPFDALVVDMRMPGMDGIALARTVQARTDQRAPRLLMLVSNYAGMDRASRRELGSLRYVHKPIHPSELHQALLALLAPDSPAPEPLADAVPRRANPGGQVLLVEDDPIYQLIALAQLEQLGLTPTLAVDGLEAVELASKRSFDLVLMDLQMPRMDGWAAARRIREWEKAHAQQRPVPIIALTSVPFAEIRAAAAAAGITDHLAKPPSADALADKISRYLRRSGRWSETVPDTVGLPQVTVGQVRIFVPSVLASLTVVSDGTAPDFAAEVLERFLDESGRTLQQFERDAMAGDLPAALRMVHTLKSSSAVVGAEALSLVAGDLERRMRAHRDLSKRDFDRLRQAHRNLTSAIAEHLIAERAGKRRTKVSKKG